MIASTSLVGRPKSICATAGPVPSSRLEDLLIYRAPGSSCPSLEPSIQAVRNIVDVDRRQRLPSPFAHEASVRLRLLLQVCISRPSDGRPEVRRGTVRTALPHVAPARRAGALDGAEPHPARPAPARRRERRIRRTPAPVLAAHTPRRCPGGVEKGLGEGDNLATA